MSRQPAIFSSRTGARAVKTVDGGRSWTKSKFIDDDSIHDIAMDLSNNQVLIAAVPTATDCLGIQRWRTGKRAVENHRCGQNLKK